MLCQPRRALSSERSWASLATTTRSRSTESLVPNYTDSSSTDSSALRELGMLPQLDTFQTLMALLNQGMTLAVGHLKHPEYYISFTDVCS